MNFTKTTTVKEAAQFLDEKYPGWYKKINVDNLNMNIYTKCILGQIYGTYKIGITNLNLVTTDSRKVFCYYKLEWIKEVKQRISNADGLNILQAVEELKKGKGIRRKCWKKDVYFTKNNVNIVHSEYSYKEVIATDWEVYNPPKNFSDLKVEQRFTLLNSNNQEFQKINTFFVNGVAFNAIIIRTCILTWVEPSQIVHINDED